MVNSICSLDQPLLILRSNSITERQSRKINLDELAIDHRLDNAAPRPEESVGLVVVLVEGGHFGLER